MQGRLSGKPVDFPLFVFVDEFTALMARSDLAGVLAPLFEAIAQEGRASLIQLCASGQIWTAERAGSTALRDSLASTYVHRMRRGQARALLPTADAARAEHQATGAAILWRSDGSIADVVIPLTTAADMVAVGRLLPSGDACQVPAKCLPSACPPDTAGAQSTLITGVEGTPAPVTDAYTARAVALFLAGQDIPAVVATLHPEINVAAGGRPYRERRAAVETLIRNELVRLRAGQ
jgi:hypothetical protein